MILRHCSVPIAIYLALQGPSSVGAAESLLRGNHPDRRSLGPFDFQKLGRSGCTVLEKVGLCEGKDGSTEMCHTGAGKRQFACELDTGEIFDIDNDVPALAEGAGTMGGAFSFEDEDARGNLLASGKDIFMGDANVDRRTGKISFVRGKFLKSKNKRPRWKRNWQVPKRQLQQTGQFGDRPVIVINAISSEGTTTTKSNAEFADSIFGSLVRGSDQVNLASQYSACSHNQLNFRPEDNRSAGIDSPVSDLVDGVATVNSIASTSEPDSVMRNDVVGKLQAEYGFGETGAEYVMVCLPPGTMTGIAYAYINHWLSVYSDVWCTYPSSQMHEVGHNLGLSHAGEGTSEYADTSGSMGYSYGIDEQKRCFSGPKMYNLGWFSDRHVELSAGEDSFSGRLYGSTKYDATTSSDKMIIRINNPSCSTCDRYISFNHDFDFNSDTRSGQNQVMIHTKEATPGAYMNTYLETKLSAGQSTSITLGEGEDEIEVDIIVGTISAADGWAEVTIGDPSTPPPTPNPVTPSPTSDPTPNPVTPSPTSNPTPNPVTPSPTSDPTPQPTNTESPTLHPVTPSPTSNPTPNPITPSPTSNPTPNPVTPSPTSNPTPNPVTPSPTNNPTPNPDTPDCTACTDIPPDWIKRKGETCAMNPKAIANGCVDKDWWVKKKFCQQTCFEAGVGYDGDNCCVQPPPDCVECTDIPPTWIARNRETCAMHPRAIAKDCVDTDWWVNNNFCQQTCFDADRGYEGPPCCG